MSGLLNPELLHKLVALPRENLSPNPTLQSSLPSTCLVHFPPHTLLTCTAILTTNFSLLNYALRSIIKPFPQCRSIILHWFLHPQGGSILLSFSQQSSVVFSRIGMTVVGVRFKQQLEVFPFCTDEVGADINRIN